MKIQSFVDVWDAIENNPEEALNMRLRSDLLIEILAQINKLNLTQKQLAEVLNVSQPRVSALINGKINLFGLDALTKFAACLGLQVQLSTSCQIQDNYLFHKFEYLKEQNRRITN